MADSGNVAPLGLRATANAFGVSPGARQARPGPVGYAPSQAARMARARRLLALARSQVLDKDGLLDRLQVMADRNRFATGPLFLDTFLADVLRHSRNFEPRPRLRVTLRIETGARASDVPGTALRGNELAAPSPWQQKSGGAILDATDQGTYLVPEGTLEQAFDRKATGVPAGFNKMLTAEIQEIPVGSILLDGLVRRLGDLPGGGRQIAHLAQLGPDGRVLERARRNIIDGVHRTPGGQTYRGDY